MPNETPSNAAQLEPLTLLVEQLTWEKEQLQTQLNELQDLLVQSESQNTQLEAMIDASAEDLQPFGSAWLKPSSVRAITYQSAGGIHIDGISIKSDNKAPSVQISAQMQSFAKRINDLNAERRTKARQRKNKVRGG